MALSCFTGFIKKGAPLEGTLQLKTTLHDGRCLGSLPPKVNRFFLCSYTKLLCMVIVTS